MASKTSKTQAAATKAAKPAAKPATSKGKAPASKAAKPEKLVAKAAPKSTAERAADAAERTARATERTAAAAERTAAAVEKGATLGTVPAGGDAQHLVLDTAGLTPEEVEKLKQFHADFKKRILHVANAARFIADK